MGSVFPRKFKVENTIFYIDKVDEVTVTIRNGKTGELHTMSRRRVEEVFKVRREINKLCFKHAAISLLICITLVVIIEWQCIFV